MKIAMLRIPPALQKAGLHAHMLLQVHDELVLEVPEDELQKTARVVQEVMAFRLPAGYSPLDRSAFRLELGRDESPAIDLTSDCIEKESRDPGNPFISEIHVPF